MVEEIPIFFFVSMKNVVLKLNIISKKKSITKNISCQIYYLINEFQVQPSITHQRK